MKKLLIIGLLMLSAWGYAQVDIRKNATYFSKGLECKYREDVQGAIKNFEEALKFMPDDAASMFELSEQYVLAGRVEDAFNSIAKAVELDPENKWYQMRLARFYRNFEQYDDFIRVYEALTIQYPGDVDMLSELIDVYLISGQYNQALEKLNLLEKEIGVNPAISEQRMEIYKRQGKTKEVMAELKQMIAQEPENTRYYHMLAKVYMENNNEAEAIKLYEQIKAIDPSDPYINVSLLEYYEKNGENQKAFEELLAAINNKKLDFNTKANIYEYWFGRKTQTDQLDQQAKMCGDAFVENYPDKKIGYAILGTYYMSHVSEENVTKALELFNKSLSLDSTDFYSWQSLVAGEAMLRDYESTYQHAKKALTFYPMQPVFYYYAGSSAALTDRREEAVAFFEKGRRFTTDKGQIADFDQFLGDLYHELGDDEKAFDAYERVLRFDPDNVLILNNYAYFLSLKGQELDKALTMATHALELAPDNVYYIDTYAWVLYKLGRYEEAEKQMQRCLKLEKTPSGSNLEHYGDILFRLNRKEEAVQYWERAYQTGEYSSFLEKKVKDKTLYE